MKRMMLIMATGQSCSEKPQVRVFIIRASDLFKTFQTLLQRKLLWQKQGASAWL